MSPAKKPKRETRKFAFTDQRIERLRPPEHGRASYYDEKCPDLGLRVTDAGRRSFFWFRWMAGKPVFRALGEWPKTSIEKAQEDARDLTNKQSKWKREEYETPDPFDRGDVDLTFGEMFDTYTEKRTLRKRSAEKDYPREKAERAAALDRWMVKKFLPGWREKKARAIHSKEVKRLHDTIGEEHGPVMADRVCQMLRRVYGWAIEQELLGGANPARLPKGMWNGHAKRKRFLADDQHLPQAKDEKNELERFFEALSTEPNRDLVDALLLALFTGARRSDIYSMRWKDVNLDARDVRTGAPKPAWTTYQSKGHLNYPMALTPECTEVLRSRKERAKADAVFVFPSYGKSGHLIELREPWNEFRKRTGLTDLHFHDLRRTLGAYILANGGTLAMVGKALGHQPGSPATAIYSEMNLDPTRAAVQGAAAAMRAIAAPNKPETQPVKAKPAKRLPARTA